MTSVFQFLLLLLLFIIFIAQVIHYGMQGCTVNNLICVTADESNKYFSIAQVVRGYF